MDSFASSVAMRMRSNLTAAVTTVCVAVKGAGNPVTGAFDKEGTARTIVDTLNSSYYRGTGGASALQAI